MGMKFCPQCNAQLDDDTKFCTTCGAPTADVPVYADAQPEAQYAEQPQYSEPAQDPYAVTEMDSVVPPIITDETFAPTQDAYAQPYQQPVQYEQQPQYQDYQQPQYQPAQQNMQMPQQNQTPDYVNPAAPQMPGVTPGKTDGSSLVVPIILIILILAVIFVDVFFLFRKQIFGDDSSSSTAAVSYVTMTDK